MVMLGAYVALTGKVQMRSIIQAFKKVFGNKSHHLIELNIAALQKGADAVLSGQHVLEAA
jgi:2-oxoglutarate ferredoxin oxidoreductase subunit gamma